MHTKGREKSFTLKIQLELDINLCAETGAKQAKAVRRVRVGQEKAEQFLSQCHFSVWIKFFPGPHSGHSSHPCRPFFRPP
jgi:hypothetical protein